MRDLTPEAIRTFLDQVGPAAPADYPLLLVELRHMGGELARPAAVEDAVCARDATYFLETVAMLRGTRRPPRRSKRPRSHCNAAMAPYGTGRTMVNIHGAPGDETDRARAWTPEVYTRLRQTKATYDPANLLRFGHAVTPRRRKRIDTAPNAPVDARERACRYVEARRIELPRNGTLKPTAVTESGGLDVRQAAARKRLRASKRTNAPTAATSYAAAATPAAAHSAE